MLPIKVVLYGITILKPHGLDGTVEVGTKYGKIMKKVLVKSMILL